MDSMFLLSSSWWMTSILVHHDIVLLYYDRCRDHRNKFGRHIRILHLGWTHIQLSDRKEFLCHLLSTPRSCRSGGPVIAPGAALVVDEPAPTDVAVVDEPAPADVAVVDEPGPADVAVLDESAPAEEEQTAEEGEEDTVPAAEAEEAQRPEESSPAPTGREPVPDPLAPSTSVVVEEDMQAEEMPPSSPKAFYTAEILANETGDFPSDLDSKGKGKQLTKPKTLLKMKGSKKGKGKLQLVMLKPKPGVLPKPVVEDSQQQTVMLVAEQQEQSIPVEERSSSSGKLLPAQDVAPPAPPPAEELPPAPPATTTPPRPAPDVSMTPLPLKPPPALRAPASAPKATATASKNSQDWLRLAKSLPTRDGETARREKLFQDMDADGGGSLDLNELHQCFLSACGFSHILPPDAEETKRMLELAYQDGVEQDANGPGNAEGITAGTFVHFLYYVVDFAQLYALFCGEDDAGPSGAPKFRIPDRDNIDVDVFKQSLPSLVIWAGDNLAFRNYLEDKEIFPTRCEGLFTQICSRYMIGKVRKPTITFPDFCDWAIRKVPINISPFRRTSVKFRVGGSTPRPSNLTGTSGVS